MPVERGLRYLVFGQFNLMGIRQEMKCGMSGVVKRRPSLGIVRGFSSRAPQRLVESIYE